MRTATQTPLSLAVFQSHTCPLTTANCSSTINPENLEAKGEVFIGILSGGSNRTKYGYHYDLAGRLTGVDKNGIASSTYTYDSNGNRLSYSGDLGNFVGTYDAQDRLLSYGDFVYEYTANGELRRKENVVTGEVWEYQIDAFGNLLSVVLPDGQIVEYVIDAANRRVGRKLNGVLQVGYLYDEDGRIVAETSPLGSFNSRFIYGYSQFVPDAMVQDGRLYRFVYDQNGTVRYVIDVVNDVVVQEVQYDEFGNVSSDSAPGLQPFRFAGGVFDQDTKLLRFGARDYDSYIGRWVAKDPSIFGGGLNLYGYVDNDPINWIDPNGRSKTEGITRGNDPYLDRIRNSDREGLKKIQQEVDDLKRRGEIKGERAKKIKAWIKLKKDGRLPAGGLCLTTVDCTCINDPVTCTELFPPDDEPEDPDELSCPAPN